MCCVVEEAFLVPSKYSLIQNKESNLETHLVKQTPGSEVIKLEYSLKLKIKRNGWHMSASSQSLPFILSLRRNSSFITSGPGISDLFSLNQVFSRQSPYMYIGMVEVSLTSSLFLVNKNQEKRYV